jgi:hypothetical protein
MNDTCDAEGVQWSGPRMCDGCDLGKANEQAVNESAGKRELRGPDGSFRPATKVCSRQAGTAPSCATDTFTTVRGRLATNH